MKMLRVALFSAVGVIISFVGFNLPAHAQQFPSYWTGEITFLEVWRTGNVAFRLETPGIPCNGHFILNVSAPGTKNQYATLMAAKVAGKTVTVYADTCGPAEGYGHNYAQVAYLYLN